MTTMRTFKYRMDLPPTANHMFISVGRRRVLSPHYRRYREYYGLQLPNAVGEPFDCLVGVTIWVHERAKKDGTANLRHRRDIDNYIKPTLDTLQAGRVFEDDCQVEQVHCLRRGPAANPYIRVVVAEYMADLLPESFEEGAIG